MFESALTSLKQFCKYIMRAVGYKRLSSSLESANVLGACLGMVLKQDCLMLGQKSLLFLFDDATLTLFFCCFEVLLGLLGLALGAQVGACGLSDLLDLCPLFGAGADAAHTPSATARFERAATARGTSADAGFLNCPDAGRASERNTFTALMCRSPSKPGCRSKLTTSPGSRRSPAPSWSPV